jgi:hypothetical protein
MEEAAPVNSGSTVLEKTRKVRAPIEIHAKTLR